LRQGKTGEGMWSYPSGFGPVTIMGINIGTIDNLTYTYNPTNKNQLTKVADGGNLNFGFKSVGATENASATHYTYDSNGNLLTDVNKGITGIVYNHLNLPLVINFTNNSSGQPRRIEFLYDATGVKLRKTILTNNVITDQRDYVNGIEYKSGVLDRFAHTEGSVIRNTSGGYEYEYTIKDHLGNTRVTYSDNNNDGFVGSSDIKQINHYYPFGLNMEGNWNGVGGANKYQYNGKEWNDDFGLNWNDYGARWYDPAVARWWAVDPLSILRNNVSPYQYVQNNPVKMIDPTGMLDEIGGHSKSDTERARRSAQISKDERRFYLTSGAGNKGKDDWIGRKTSTGDTQYQYVDEKGLSLEDARKKYGSDVSVVRENGHTFSSASGRVALGENGEWTYLGLADKPIDLLDKATLVGGFNTDIKAAILTAGQTLKGVGSKMDGVLGTLDKVGKAFAWGGVAADAAVIFNKYQKGEPFEPGDVAKLAFDISLAIIKVHPVAAITIGVADALWDLSGEKDKFFKSK
jgi:RHS repeat-associated protein